MIYIHSWMTDKCHKKYLDMEGCLSAITESRGRHFGESISTHHHGPGSNGTLKDCFPLQTIGFQGLCKFSVGYTREASHGT